jgi:hypothetical protein
LQKHLKPLQKHTQHSDKTLANICVQHTDKHTCNIRQKKHMKYWEQKIATYMCNHCNISIYFCNIYIKHLQHISGTLKTDACNMLFQAQHLLVRAYPVQRAPALCGV